MSFLFLQSSLISSLISFTSVHGIWGCGVVGVKPWDLLWCCPLVTEVSGAHGRPTSDLGFSASVHRAHIAFDMHIWRKQAQEEGGLSKQKGHGLEHPPDLQHRVMRATDSLEGGGKSKSQG